jgi:hypothetical protein
MGDPRGSSWFKGSFFAQIEDRKEFNFPSVTVCNLNMLSYNKINHTKPPTLSKLVTIEDKYTRSIRSPQGSKFI